MLSGKIEVVKRFDGVERPLGFRLPGTIFGEVPLAFATPFPRGYREGGPLPVIQPTTVRTQTTDSWRAVRVLAPCAAASSARPGVAFREGQQMAEAVRKLADGANSGVL